MSKNDLTMGKWYALNGELGFMYFGISNLKHNNLENQIFACKEGVNVGPLSFENYMIHTIPSNQISEIRGRNVAIEDRGYYSFSESREGLMNFCANSMKNGLKKGIKIREKQR